jgi:hypothetical protein
MNGTVKVILVCGFSLVFGFYAFMVQGMNNRIIQVADQKSYYTEARMVATAGLNHAIYTMKSEQYWWYLNNGYTLVMSNLLAGGDTVSYTIDRPFSFATNEARVTVTADFNGVAAKQVTVIKNVTFAGPYSFSGSILSRCQVQKAYVYPYQLPKDELPS